jgi:hypothetical protein
MDSGAAVDDVWLNRWGIVLNVVAGILLAPELIGLERLRAFEGWLERKLPSLHNALSRLRAVLSPDRWAGPIVTATTIGGIVWLAVVNLGPPDVRKVAGDIIDELGILYLMSLALYGIWLVVASLDVILGRVIRSLSGENRIVAFMVVAGISLFLLGNVFQFVATF